MNFKDMLSKISELSEAKEKTKTGIKHTAEPGGYGRKVDASGDDDNEPKKKRGGQEKDEGPKFDAPTKGDIFGRTSGTVPAGKKGTQHTKMKDADKAEKKAEKAEKKKGLKEFFDSLDRALNEAEQVTIAPAQQNTQVIKQGTKTLGTVTNPQLANQIKQSIGKGEMSLNPHGEEMAEGQDEGKPGKNFAKIAKSAAQRYGSKAAGERVAGAVRAKLMKQGKIEEADLPSNDADMGAGLGAGRSQATFEGKKPDFLDVDKDGNKKESFKKAVKDKESKKEVKEGMDSRLKAAHHAGKSHALSKQGYNCAYDDLEEARMYHEGYKQGLDECYGQAPIMGYMGEENTTDVVDNMASYGAEDNVDEGNAFTAALNRTPHGGQFKLGSKTFTDRSTIEEDPVFESWDNQLNSLIEEYDTIQEGLNVSISKGNEGAPDSVSVTAQDGEADALLQFIKQAGLGIFGGEEQPAGPSSPMSVQPEGEPETAEIGVVGDHDGMMDLIKKVTGAEAGQPTGGEITIDTDGEEGEEQSQDQGHEEGDDYKDEGDSDKEETDEATCNECGMAESQCGCSHDDKEQVDEVESEDQMTYQMAEDNPPDSGAEETAATDAEVAQDNAAASSHGGAMNSNLEEDELEESYANSDDDQFETDIDFMTKVISGGLNKPKATGQTTAPVIAGQNDRMGYEVNESISDWKALAGIK